MMKKEKGKVFLWRMEKPCENCPFIDGPMRQSLRRIEEIERDMLAGKHFLCHKTTQQTGNKTNLVCAGALDFQQAHGVTSGYEILCTALKDVGENREEIFRRLKQIVHQTRTAPLLRSDAVRTQKKRRSKAEPRKRPGSDHHEPSI